MKKTSKMWRVSMILLSVSVAALLLALTVYSIVKTVQGTIAVFDLANFICSLVFSLIALGFSIHEVSKQEAAEKAEAHRAAQLEKIEQSVSRILEEKNEKINRLQPIRSTDIIPDYPTYAELPLTQMCELYDSFHKASFNENMGMLRDYLMGAQEVVLLVVENGEYLAPSAVSAALSLGERISRLLADYTHFLETSGVHYWQIYLARNVKPGTLEEADMRKLLYQNGNAVCIEFNVLYENVMLSRDWLNALCKAITKSSQE